MKSLRILFVASLIPLLSACRQAPPAGAPVLIRQEFTLTGASRCDTTVNKGVDVSVGYFQLQDTSEGAQKINDSLRMLAVGSITGWLDSATVAANPDARTDLHKAAALLAADYRAVTNDMDGLGSCWELKTETDTTHTSASVLTAKMETYAYTGGAHPNSNASFYMFDRQTGHTLSLTDVVSDTTALLTVVEQAFRRQQELPPRVNLEERGYFLRDGRFFLPDNVGMSREGMVFYYNPYEIAAYALGPIEVTVPYTELGGILRTD